MARLPTIVKGGVPQSREIHPYVRVQPPAHLDEDTKRFLTQLQDNVHAATLPARCDTTLQSTIVHDVVFTKGANVTVRHNLGQPFAGYRCTRAYAGSAAFAQQPEAANNGGQDVKVYLVLASEIAGTYDIEVFAG